MGFLRWFLAISVLSAHSEPLFGITMLDPLSAVKLFYVISGFYMALVLTTKYTSAASLRHFYFNRFLRLYPTYFIIALLTIAAMLYFDSRMLSELFHLPWSSFISDCFKSASIRPGLAQLFSREPSGIFFAWSFTCL